MEELKYQIKLAKTLYIFDSPPKKWKLPLKYLQLFAIMLLNYSIVSYSPRLGFNIVDVFECVVNAVTCVMSVTKYAVLAFYSVKVFETIKELKELNLKWKSTAYFRFIEDFNRLDRIVFAVIYLSALFAFLGYVIAPITTSLLTYFIRHEGYPFNIPFIATYFYDLDDFPTYVLSYFTQIFTAYYSAFSIVLIDTTFFGISMNICAHFEILQRVINDMELKDFVEYHKQMLDITSKVNSMFSIVIFQEFTILSLLLGLISFRVVITNSIGELIPVFFHGLACVTTLLVYAYGGQKIMDSAEKICTDCYIIDRNYIIIMMRTKKELKIESYLSHASLPTFTLIMNRTMSLFALLKSFM